MQYLQTWRILKRGFIIVGKYLDTQIEYQFYFATFHG